MDLRVNNQGELQAGSRSFPCVLGRSGLAFQKQEGDGATPIGRFPLRGGFYRADRLDKPPCHLDLRALDPADGWCDDPSRPAFYNQFVRHPFDGSAERLWRDDNRYDIIIILGYNDDPIVPGVGSAIFMHLAAEDHRPTEGCVALDLSDLLTVLSLVGPGDCIDIRP